MRKGGYIFTLARSGESDTADSPTTPCNAATVTPASGYFASANPVGFVGSRYFATDKRGSIYEDITGPLTNPIPATATPFK